jgi:ribonuclease P/MRP protein subunit RPP1
MMATLTGGPIDLCMRADGLSRTQLRDRVVHAGELGYAAVALECEIQLPANGSETLVQPLSQAELGSLSETAPIQLKRVTAVLNEPQHAGAMRSQAFMHLARTADIVAVKPSSERCFELACVDCPATIIQLELHKRMGFRLKASQLKGARSRGVKVEVLYGQARSSPQARRQAIANGHSLSLGLRPRKDTVVSSGAVASASTLCKPRECCAYYALLLGKPSALDLLRCVGANAHSCIQR